MLLSFLQSLAQWAASFGPASVFPIGFWLWLFWIFCAAIFVNDWKIHEYLLATSVAAAACIIFYYPLYSLSGIVVVLLSSIKIFIDRRKNKRNKKEEKE